MSVEGSAVSAGSLETTKRRKDYDSYLNIFDEREVESTLVKGSDITIHTV